MTDLPDLILLKIQTYLPMNEDWCRFMKTYPRVYRLADHDDIWKRFQHQGHDVDGYWNSRRNSSCEKFLKSLQQIFDGFNEAIIYEFRNIYYQTYDPLSPTDAEEGNNSPCSLCQELKEEIDLYYYRGEELRKEKELVEKERAKLQKLYDSLSKIEDLISTLEKCQLVLKENKNI